MTQLNEREQLIMDDSFIIGQNKPKPFATFFIVYIINGKPKVSQSPYFTNADQKECFNYFEWVDFGRMDLVRWIYADDYAYITAIDENGI